MLPFVEQSAVTANEAAETANSYFSNGLVEDIISALSCLPEAGRDLAHVDAVLPRHDTGPAAGPSRVARALHAVGQRTPRRRQGPGCRPWTASMA